MLQTSINGVWLSGTAREHARAMAGNQRSHAAGALRDDRDWHGAVEPAARRACAGKCRNAATWRRGAASRRAWQFRRPGHAGWDRSPRSSGVHGVLGQTRRDARCLSRWLVYHRRYRGHRERYLPHPWSNKHRHTQDWWPQSIRFGDRRGVAPASRSCRVWGGGNTRRRVGRACRRGGSAERRRRSRSAIPAHLGQGIAGHSQAAFAAAGPRCASAQCDGKGNEARPGGAVSNQRRRFRRLTGREKNFPGGYGLQTQQIPPLFHRQRTLGAPFKPGFLGLSGIRITQRPLVIRRVQCCGIPTQAKTALEWGTQAIDRRPTGGSDASASRKESVRQANFGILTTASEMSLDDIPHDQRSLVQERHYLLPIDRHLSGCGWRWYWRFSGTHEPSRLPAGHRCYGSMADALSAIPGEG